MATVSEVDTLASLKKLIGGLPDAERAKLANVVKGELQKKWLPNPGPQTEAYLSKADVLLYGGAAGGGKTDLLIGLSLNEHERSIIFRMSYADLAGPSGVESRLLQILGGRDGYNGQNMAWSDGKASVELGALDKPGAEQSYQGRPHDFIGLDEGAQLPEHKVRYVMGWLRSASGRRCRVVIGSNPPQNTDGEWLLRWFQPWLDPAFTNPAKPGELRWAAWSPDDVMVWLPDGRAIVWLDSAGAYRLATEEEAADLDREDVVRPQSYTFIPARLKDNPHLRGTGYLKRLQSMPEPLRSQLMKGDFMAGRVDGAKQVIPTEWVEAAMKRWTADGGRSQAMCSLGVDVAQGGADKTVIAPLHNEWFAPLVAVRGVDTKDGASVAALVVQHRRGLAIPIIDCTGGWGSSAREQLEAQGIRAVAFVASAGFGERTLPDQNFGFINNRSGSWWRFREALDPNGEYKIALPPDAALKAQLTAPTWNLRGDKIIIESKDDIRERLGRSTDEADAVIMAWFKREIGLKALVMSEHNWSTAVPLDDPYA